MFGLSARQKEILEFIEEHQKTKGHAPSYREIQSRFEFSSLGTVYQHLQALKKKQAVRAVKGMRRSIAVEKTEKTPSINQDLQIPLIGLIAGGLPLELFSAPQMISVPQHLVPNPHESYVLRVIGDGLNDEQIVNGDLLIIETNSEPADGETVLALINQGKTVIKRLHDEGIHFRLLSRSPASEPIILKREKVKIQGLLVGLIRVY